MDKVHSSISVACLMTVPICAQLGVPQLMYATCWPRGIGFATLTVTPVLVGRLVIWASNALAWANPGAAEAELFVAVEAELLELPQALNTRSAGSDVTTRQRRIGIRRCLVPASVADLDIEPPLWIVTPPHSQRRSCDLRAIRSANKV